MPDTTPSTSYWLHWSKLNWISKTAATLRRRLSVRGQSGGLVRRLAQAASAFMLAASMLLGAAPRPALAVSTPGFVLSTSSAPFGLPSLLVETALDFVDLDHDGDLDAAIGSADGRTSYYHNTGSAINPAFVNSGSSSPFGLPDVGDISSPSFGDLDGDGVFDVALGTIDGRIKLVENTGTPKLAAFGGAQHPEDVGDWSKPVLVDIDHDGDLDVISGSLTGQIFFLLNTENAITVGLGSAETSTAPFGLTDVGAKSAPAFADLDLDGDLDAFVGEEGGNINYFRNTGSAVAPAFVLSSSTAPFGLTDVGSESTPAFADLDGDGDLDAFVGEAIGYINYFENTGPRTPPGFVGPTTNPFGLTPPGTYASPAFGDLDGDGDPDVLAGQLNGNLEYFENTGSAVAPAFAAALTNPFGLSSPSIGSAPELVDIDTDGDLDVFYGNDTGTTLFFRNTGDAVTPAFLLTSSSMPFGLTAVATGYSTPSFVDLEGDGDLDALVGETDGTLTIFFNTGTAIAPAFFEAEDDGSGLPYVASAWADIDGDGDQDLLLGQQNGTFEFRRNTGNAVIPDFEDDPIVGAMGLTGIGIYSTPAFVDINSDGRLDVFSGSGAGNLLFFKGAGTIFLPLALRS